MYIFYQIGVYFYYLLIRFASLFNDKASQWINGRKAQVDFLKTELTIAKRVWFHFASLGEFEQGRSVMEAINKNYPEYKIIITFFSPSGYEIRKNYALAEKVYYLPLDTKKNAEVFLKHIKPTLIIFNKYEYWFHYINEAKKLGIPLFVISSIFREKQIFFKWYGSFQRYILTLINHFFLQNKESENLLRSINVNNFTIAGDTRFDRVYEHSLNPGYDKTIEDFCSDKEVFVAGSTWPKDEQIIANTINRFPELKTIIVPHEVSDSNISSIKKLFGIKAGLYSELKDKNIPTDINVLIVDKVGLLSSIYKHAKYTYIGGGFGVGIHNTLEAAAYGKLIFFGPNYHKFSEAKELIEIGSAKSINNEDELIAHLQYFSKNSLEFNTASNSAKEFVIAKKGATKIIMDYIEANKFLV